jgi:hypothetical protein
MLDELRVVFLGCETRFTRGNLVRDELVVQLGRSSTCVKLLAGCPRMQL